MSQRELAAEAGTPQSTIARYESGAVVPGFDALERILAVLRHRLVLEATDTPDPDDVALAAWFISLDVEDRIDAWENWLRLVDDVSVVS